MSDSEPRPTADDRPATLHAIVRGRVQGVGFREYVVRHARTRGISGWVRNLPDGRSVEVAAGGGRAALESLLSRLQQGPSMAYVTAVEVEWLDQPADGAGFEVRY